MSEREGEIEGLGVEIYTISRILYDHIISHLLSAEVKSQVERWGCFLCRLICSWFTHLVSISTTPTNCACTIKHVKLRQLKCRVILHVLALAKKLIDIAIMSVTPALAFDEFGRPFIILKDQSTKKRLRGIEAHKVYS